MAGAAARRIAPGSPEPLGAALVPGGVNVAVYSAHATAIDFCLFDAAGQVELERIALVARTGDVFHAFIEGVPAGARYGLRAHGPFAPRSGHRFNANKLLIDPYAVAIDRPFQLHPSMFGYRLDDPQGGASFDETDSAPAMPKAIVGDPGAAAPGARIPWDRSVIYEAHVRGFTRLHPDVPDKLRGTFAALAHPAAVRHLTDLGATTLELLPTAAWIDERHLPPLGLTNYWGYNPVAFMVPDPRLAPGGWAEVRAAVAALAKAGVEVVLDVVFNHSGEGDALGPTLSLRGLDNATYYRLHTDDPARYINDAGTGNVLALDRPAGVRLVMDSLRAWARLGGVSGFRFDLATVLGRRSEGFDPAAPLLAAIDQDPELRGLKLIAEPWDCGPGGYQLGRFPGAWGEWNDRFRDTARRFWRGHDTSLGALAGRISGSQDLLGRHGRPSRSVNFVVAHDGFTLADLVAYETKRNDANGEAGRDGTDDNLSWNNGVEGPSDDPAVVAARMRDQRALLATLLLSRGAAMLAMGSEFGQSQGGNNNAYAQDSALTWLDWKGGDRALAAFVARLIRARRDHAALRADGFLTGRPQGTAPYPDVEWFAADGAALDAHAWDDPRGATLIAVLAAPDESGGLDRVTVAFHRGPGAIEVRLPDNRDGHGWRIAADSAGDACSDQPAEGETLTVAARSVVLLAETRTSRPPAGIDDQRLDRLAAEAGVASDWWSLAGERTAVSPQTQRALLAAMDLPGGTVGQARESLWRLGEGARRALPFSLVRRTGQIVSVPLGEPRRGGWLAIRDEQGGVRRLPLGADAAAIDLPPLPEGRYRLWREDMPDAACSLTIAPAACYLPPALAEGRRLWGVSAQLYALKRDGDQGVGDFTTLGDLAEAVAARGGAAVTLNPFHALFPKDRGRASPYYPSDRRFLEPFYIDLAQIPFAGPAAPGQSEAASVDYPAMWAVKDKALKASFAAFADLQKRQPDHPDVQALDAFVGAGGQALAEFAAFQAGAGAAPGYQAYLQWLCERQLAAAAARASGLELGLCRDLAIGAAPDGAEATLQGHLFAAGAAIGAPPDPFSAAGQVWGLPPPIPHQWTREGYASFSTLLAANMRHAGALRIDHVMGLARLFWVPQGAEGKDGAYVAYPLQDLLGELALESHRARCLVIGEDLGAPPEGLRETLTRERVLSYRVLPFERSGEAYIAPAAYPAEALACVSTHDLPTLAGWWSGADVDEAAGLGLISGEAADKARADRQADKARLLQALVDAGLPAAGEDGLTPALAAAIHGFIASAPSWLAVVQTEDLAGERVAVNLPGTDRERPNWRRRLAPSVEALFETDGARAILRAVRAARPA